MPAQATANSVIASAKRLIEVRHSCRKRSRMAEISVPAWPMPIHQTKLMIAKPQPMGTLTPQIPTPFSTRWVSATNSSIIRANETAKPANQPHGVRRWRTMLLIFSVTEAKSWPGPISSPVTGGGVASLARSATGHLGVGVAHRGQVGRARTRVQLREEDVVAGLGLEPGHPALGVVDVSEDDRLARARLLASGLDLAVADRPPLVAGVDAHPLDALDAVRAFLHDAAAAHRDFRVSHQLEGGRAPVLVEEEVEAAHLVRAVVRAVPRAYAAVVDLVVEALVAVDGGGDRADGLARRVLALHAGDRLVVRLQRLRLLGVAGVVAVHADPVHLAAAADLVLADDGDVVLGHARGHARVAADAGVQVDAHAPRVPFVLVGRVQREVRRRILLHLLREGRRALVLLQARRPHDGAAFHAPVVLRAGQPVALARPAHLGPRRPPWPNAR